MVKKSTKKPTKKPKEKYLLRDLNQIGTSNLFEDALRPALLPGKRKSPKGNIYWETRKNRSDERGKKI